MRPAVSACWRRGWRSVGVEDANAIGPWVDYANVIQALLSIVIMSLIITFLVNVFGAIRALRDLTSSFYRANAVVPSAKSTLEPFFPRGAPRGLDLYLSALLEDVNEYFDEIRANRTGYYFQSGRAEFSLPFAITMTAETVGCLRWAVPREGADAETAVWEEPDLLRLAEAVGMFRRWLNKAIGFTESPVPAPVSQADFEAAYTSKTGDPWVVAFRSRCDDMAHLMHLDADAASLDGAYTRYTEWLHFAFHGAELYRNVSRDLDHQPEKHALVTA